MSALKRPSSATLASLVRMDRKHVWHPFTQMADWNRNKPLFLIRGRGAVLEDLQGRTYLDANASIWTNLHGHGHPAINRALRRQAGLVSHVSMLGFANEPATRLAAELVRMARPKRGPSTLQKVFYSDNGSTAMEVALKLAHEHARRARGLKHARFLAVDGAYHGDTIGAVSLGQIDLFHGAYSDLLFPTDKVMAPYCYRCPFNRAQPARGDARTYRRCGWECLGKLEQRLERAGKTKRPITAFSVEPLMQGAAGMIAQPKGWLSRAAEVVRGHGALLIADEVMTGFGRTGNGTGGETPAPAVPPKRAPLLACQVESVQPDLLALAKGLTGGYLPMAATLVTDTIYSEFLGRYEDFRTFFHGHSFTGNPLGAAAGLANLELLNAPARAQRRHALETRFAKELNSLWTCPQVGDVRQVGLVAGIELVRDWTKRTPFALAERAGIRVCDAMRQRGVLTRPIGSVVVLMPPYCTTDKQLTQMVAALRESIEEVLGTR